MEDIQAQFKTEGDPAFPVADTETDNSADSPSGEETTENSTQSPEGDENAGGDENKQGDGSDNDKDKNLADHPRWQERENDWKDRFNDQEKRHTDEISALREEMESLKGNNNAAKGDDAPSEVPSWFGGDEQQWKEFVAWNESLAQKAQENAVKQVSSQQEAEQKAIQEATDYFNSEVSTIESDKTLNPQGQKVDKNKLLKSALDNELVDTKGRWNYRAAWRLMQANVTNAKNDTIQEKKEIASATTSENKAEPTTPKVATSDTFQNPTERPW